MPTKAGQPSPATGFKRALGQALLRSPFHRLYLRLTAQRDVIAEYRRCLARRPRSKPETAHLPYQPLISVLMPVHNPKRDWLIQAMQSVRAQSYTHWELCVCDDASEPWVANLLRRRLDARCFISPRRLGISGALNQARRIATGEYLCFLDHDDLLAPDALAHIVTALNGQRADFVYTDEDYVDASGRPLYPNLKPDWSPELLSNCMYSGHLMLVSAQLFDTVGGFRSDYDGAQDYDFALRATELAQHIAHVPEILYHWRQHANSIARSTASKPYSHRAGMKALEDALRRRGDMGKAGEDHISNQYIVRREPANFDDKLIYLDRDLIPETADAPAVLAAQAGRPGIAIAGAKIIALDGTLEHGGIVLDGQGDVAYPGRGEAVHPFWKWLDFTRDVTAVSSSAMVVSKAVFEQLGGFDPALPNLQDVDLCLRARAAGYGVIFEANAVFRRTGPSSPRTPSASELAYFRDKWKALAGRPDPYYNPFLTRC